jgi:hypothetical protein
MDRCAACKRLFSSSASSRALGAKAKGNYVYVKPGSQVCIRSIWPFWRLSNDRRHRRL